MAEELEALRQREQQTREEIEKRLAAELPARATTGITSSSSFSYSAPAGSLDLDAPRIPFAGREFDAPSFPVDTPTPTPSSFSETSKEKPATAVDGSRETVLKEIERLRSKLESRKKLTALDDHVERAKSAVVSCLRLHDRRPLDCWQEVENFKQEVAKLERAFVDKVVG